MTCCVTGSASPTDNGFLHQHGVTEVAPGVRLHHVTAGSGPRTVVLLHGFPQTWWEWRHVIPLLVAAGYSVVAPDYRGAGGSSRPVDGYDKLTMAGDLQVLLERLGIADRVVLVGHDIGLMVAYAFAQRFSDAVSHLIVLDAPLPGTDAFDGVRTDSRVWHFGFHGARDVAEMLVTGRERQYLRAFFDVRTGNPAAIGDAELEIFASAYSAPGAMRAGFELYRAFDRDAADNRDLLARNGPLRIPVLALGGSLTASGEVIGPMMREVATDVTADRLAGAGHWIPEECPAELVGRILAFAGHPAGGN